MEDVAEELIVGHVGSMTSEYVETGVPFLRSKNVDPFNIVWDDMKYISREFHGRLKKSTLSPGDVVIVRTGKPGAAALVPDTLPEANCSDLVIVRCGPEIDRRFLVYYLNSAAKHHVHSHLVGAVQQHFNVGAARKLRMQLPPLAEQKAIARILGTLDEKIELNRRMNETLEGIARAVFKSWFVDFDPVRAKLDGRQPAGMDPATAALFPDGFEDTELGKVPRGWRTSPVYDTARFINGATFRGEHFCEPEDGLPVIKIAELKSGISAQTKYSNRQDLDPKYRIDSGTLLYSWSGSPDTSLDTFVWSLGPGLLNQHIFKIDADSEAQLHFVYYMLKYLRPALIEIARNKQTTGLGHVTVADMRRLHFCSPPATILHAFDQCAGPLYRSCYQNALQSQTLSALRDTLLPKLLSGEIRVGEAAEIVGE
ncbi:restriction endonuclease subunit S [Aeoliella straminimaris]|uniref:restriction endonuclease subunit S n=1 Tax=Aeoliella straminimaris TaxID=2954799 RepID=UPI0020923E16|nr:restriction endonuclease subunit S [Aeoliella straminimaris]